MSLKTKTPAFRMTRAYQEGFAEGRLGVYTRNPYEGGRKQEITEWAAGYRRGTVLKHFYEETVPKDLDIAQEVLKIRRQVGEKV